MLVFWSIRPSYNIHSSNTNHNNTRQNPRLVRVRTQLGGSVPNDLLVASSGNDGETQTKRNARRTTLHKQIGEENWIAFGYKSRTDCRCQYSKGNLKGYPLLTIETYFSTDKREKLNIEHITAQRTESLKMTKEFEEESLHSLGNLVIDTTLSNSRKSNNSVDKKLQEYSKAPIMPQNEINEEKIDWDDIKEVKSFIDERNKVLIDFIKKNLL